MYRQPQATGAQLQGLSGQRVVVTAGAGGIGLAISRRLIEAGCRLVICDVSEEALTNFGKEFPQSDAMLADVSSEADVEALFMLVDSRLGGLDALINNAGIAGPTGDVDEIDASDWRRTIDVCLTGQFLCTRLAVPKLKVQGGAIVNMSSAAGRFGYAYRTPYSAAKFGVIGFTQSLAKELGPAGIRVNAILPGIVAGARIERVIAERADRLNLPYEEMEQKYLENISMRRMVEPEEIADTVRFLLSDSGRNISGQSIGIDGNVETL